MLLYRWKDRASSRLVIGLQGLFPIVAALLLAGPGPLGSEDVERFEILPSTEGSLTFHFPQSGDSKSPVRVIFDTDMDTDCDDAGALAMLHALADREEATILATLVSSRYQYSAPCVEAINRYYGRPKLPIGVPKGDGASTSRGSRYAKTIAEEYPTRLESNDDAPSAATVYRKILAEHPERSVVVVTVGYLTNIRDLLATGPDAHSDLTGRELVERKVKYWVCMGGRYPEERDPGVHGNFKPDPGAAVTAVRKWPGVIYFSGHGRKIQTGKLLRSRAPDKNPVRRIYDLYLGRRRTRPSWDQVALLYAIRPGAPYWNVKTRGYNHIFPNGTNQWRSEPETPNRRLVGIPADARARVTRIIEELMVHTTRQERR